LADLNFFSIYFEEQRKNKKKALIYAAILFFIFASIGGTYAAMEIKARLLKSEIEEMQLYLQEDDVRQQLQEYGEKMSKYDILNEYGQAVDSIALSLEKCNTINSTLIENLCSTIPSSLTIESLVFASRSISIQGVSDDRVHIAEFFHNLSGLDIFSSVNIHNIQGEQTYSFEIDCMLKEVLSE